MLSNCFCCISQSQSLSQRLSTHSSLSRYLLITPFFFLFFLTNSLSIRLTSIWLIMGWKKFLFISHREDIHLRVLMQNDHQLLSAFNKLRTWVTSAKTQVDKKDPSWPSCGESHGKQYENNYCMERIFS